MLIRIASQLSRPVLACRLPGCMPSRLLRSRGAFHTVNQVTPVLAATDVEDEDLVDLPLLATSGQGS